MLILKIILWILCGIICILIMTAHEIRGKNFNEYYFNSDYYFNAFCTLFIWPIKMPIFLIKTYGPKLIWKIVNIGTKKDDEYDE